MQNLKKTFNYLYLSLALLLFQVNIVFGQTIGGASLDGKFEGWIRNLLITIISIAGVAAAAVLIFNAFLYITAGGEEAKITKATKGITFAIVGLILAAIAFLIVNFVIADILTKQTSQDYF